MHLRLRFPEPLRTLRAILLAGLFTAPTGCAGAQDHRNLIEVGEDRLVSVDGPTRPLAEQHLVAHPQNPNHLLAGVIVASTPELTAEQYCATFTSFDGGRTWIRHDFAVPRCHDPWVVLRADGTALFAALAPETGAELLVFRRK